MIDRIMWLGGEVEEVVHAELRAGLERKIEAETVAAVVVRLKNGAIGTITATTLAYDGMPQRVLICGTEGSCAFSGDELVYFKTSRPFEEGEESITAAPAKSAAGDALAIGTASHLANIRDFAMAVREGRRPQVTGKDSREFTRVLNEIYRKAGIAAFQ